MIEFILGGARSGKSRYAEQQALNTNKEVVYIATAHAGDNEMARRIEQHQRQRPDHWITIEEPIYLTSILEQHDQTERVFLIDCLTLWLSNTLFQNSDQANEQRLSTEKSSLLDTLPTLTADVILVSNEIGQGITPMNAMSRQFIDEAGLLHQQLSECCDRVTFVTAGIPHQLKP